MSVFDISAAARERVKRFDLGELCDAGLISHDRFFYPSVHYPPITMYPPVSEDGLFGGYRIPDDGMFDVYVHIPFCMQCCDFCHYPVITGDAKEEKDRYLSALEKETDIYMRRLGIERIRARSILVGGGTPTHLSPAQLRRFLDSFAARVDTAACSQFSYDVDPVTLLGAEGDERLKMMRDAGVHRLTIGAQSFDDEVLRRMHRHHNAAAVHSAVGRALKAGFKVCIEFIYGYPGQTFASWAGTVSTASSLGVDEIQVYRLKVIPYGDHAGLIRAQFKGQIDEYFDLTMMMKAAAIVILGRHGYEENLTRVYSRTPDDYSRYAHNQCCNLFDQIGLGLTAFSSLRDRFGLNTFDFDEYYASIRAGRLPVNRGLVRSRDDQMRWALILPLKNRRVYKKYYERVNGVSLDTVFRSKIKRLMKYDLVCEDSKTLGLTPRGRFLADEVCQQFHHPDYMPFSRDAYPQGELYPFKDCQPEDIKT